MKNLLDVLRGIAMGICDLIPGISGGTMALIFGIYERLILACSSLLHWSAVLEVLSVVFLPFRWKQVGSVFVKYDLFFLFRVLLGILLALLLGSGLISYLLSEYFVFVMSFFIGLVFASALVLFSRIRIHDSWGTFFGALGIVLGLLLLVVVPAEVAISIPYIILSGFIGIFALFLPGISGSYLLVLLGSYSFMLDSLTSPLLYWQWIAAFLLGAFFGAFCIVRLVRWLFVHYESRSFYFLTGFVLGSLGVVVRDVLRVLLVFNDFLLGVLSLLFLAVGVVLVLVLERI